MRKTIISHVKLRVQIEEKPPQELIDSYLKGTKESAKKTYEHLKEFAPDRETVIEKIIKPGIKGPKGLFKPEAFTTRGTKIKDSFRTSQADMGKQAERWLKKVKYAHRYDGKEYIASIKNMAEYYAKEMSRLVLPFRGYKDKIRGVGPVAARWLTGDLTVVKRVSWKEIIKGKPIDITQPDIAGIFRNRFISQILSSGGQIIRHAYQPSEFTYANEQINQLVTGYTTDKFGLFTPGGASHVDFIREDRQLILEVQVSVA